MKQRNYLESSQRELSASRNTLTQFTDASCFCKHLAHLLHPRRVFCKMWTRRSLKCTFREMPAEAIISWEGISLEQKHSGLAPRGWECFPVKMLSTNYIFKQIHVFSLLFVLLWVELEETTTSGWCLSSLPCDGGKGTEQGCGGAEEGSQAMWLECPIWTPRGKCSKTFCIDGSSRPFLRLRTALKWVCRVLLMSQMAFTEVFDEIF